MDASFPIPEALCIFSGMLYPVPRQDAIGSQGFGYIGYVLRYVGARQVESSGGEIWCIRFNHDAVSGMAVTAPRKSSARRSSQTTK